GQQSALFVLAFHEHIQRLAQIPRDVLLLCLPADLRQLPAPRFLLIVRNLIWKLLGRGPRTLRESEYMRPCESHSSGDMQRRFEGGSIFPRESDHNVAGDGKIGKRSIGALAQT